MKTATLALVPTLLLGLAAATDGSDWSEWDETVTASVTKTHYTCPCDGASTVITGKPYTSPAPEFYLEWDYSYDTTEVCDGDDESEDPSEWGNCYETTITSSYNARTMTKMIPYYTSIPVTKTLTSYETYVTAECEKCQEKTLTKTAYTTVCETPVYAITSTGPVTHTHTMYQTYTTSLCGDGGCHPQTMTKTEYTTMVGTPVYATPAPITRTHTAYVTYTTSTCGNNGCQPQTLTRTEYTTTCQTPIFANPTVTSASMSITRTLTGYATVTTTVCNNNGMCSASTMVTTVYTTTCVAASATLTSTTSSSFTTFTSSGTLIISPIPASTTSSTTSSSTSTTSATTTSVSFTTFTSSGTLIISPVPASTTSSTTSSSTPMTTSTTTSSFTTFTSSGTLIISPVPASTTSTTTSSVSTTTSAAAGATQTIDVTGMTYINAMLIAHNVHRTNHSEVILTWNATLAAIAGQTASSCNYAHDTATGGGGYGQNIGAGAAGNAAAGLINNLMYNGEINSYPQPYGNNNPDLTNFAAYGHYSQIVWASTTMVGCATQYCPNGLQGVGANVPPYFTVCNYLPAGNYVGQFANVLPPQGGATVVIIGS